MCLLKKDTLFYWDDQDQGTFDNLKHALTHSPVLHPSNYSKYFMVYVASSTTTIGMVLVQEDLNSQQHMIYYLSKSLLDSETHYPHVEMLALAMVIAVQKFRHYILLCTIIFLTDQNPLYYILTRQV